jgi:hypothetical protein
MAEWDVVKTEPLEAPKAAAKVAAPTGEWSVVSHEPEAVEGGPVPSTGAPKGFYAVTGDDGKQTLRRELGPADFIKSLSDLPGVGMAERIGQGATRLAGKAVSGIAGLFGADPTKIQGAVNNATELPPSNDPLVQGAQLVGQGASAVATPIDKAVGNLSPGLRTGIEAAGEAIPDIAGVLGMRGLAGATGATRAAGAAEDTGQGFRNADANPIARDIAGGSGKDALTIHNQTVGNAIAGSEAGVAQSAKLGYPNVIAARAAPNSVYDRVATAVPDGPLNDTAQNGILRAGQPEGGRVSQGSPVAQQQIETLRQQLLSQTNREGGQWTGQNWVNELRGLRQEGFGNVASEDVSNQQLGRAQLDMARAIEGHIGDSIPANANVSLQQFQDARQALAKNFAVQGALRGSHVDMGALARAQRADPELLTGGLKHIADFANDNPDVTGLASRIYSPPSYTQDLMGVPGTHRVENFLSPSFWSGAAGGQALARRVLTGSTPDAVAAMQSRFPGRGTGQFGPLEPAPPEPQGPPAGLLPSPSMVNAGGGATTQNILNDLGLTPDVQAAGPQHPGVARLGAPQPGPVDRGPMPTLEFQGPQNYGGLSLQPHSLPPAAARRFGSAPLADLLSEGLERPATPGLTAGPMGAPAGEGLPFRVSPDAVGAQPVQGGAPRLLPRVTDDYGNEVNPNVEPRRSIPLDDRFASTPSPGLKPVNQQPRPEASLADLLGDLRDYAGVRSQGVPEGIAARTNNASGESSASVEAINRDKIERAAGQDRFLVDPDGKMWPIRGVDAVDARAPKGSIIIQKGVGAEPFSILDRGGLPQQHARGLMNRAMAGGTGLSLADLLGGASG